MMKVLAVAVLLFAGVGAQAASTGCGDEYVVDCGHFKFISRTCPIYSQGKELIGATQSYLAEFADKNEYPMQRQRPKWRTENDVYQTELDSDSQLFVVVSPRKGVNQNIELVYSTYRISDGIASATSMCSRVN